MMASAGRAPSCRLARYTWTKVIADVDEQGERAR